MWHTSKIVFNIYLIMASINLIPWLHSIIIDYQGKQQIFRTPSCSVSGMHTPLGIGIFLLFFVCLGFITSLCRCKLLRTFYKAILAVALVATSGILFFLMTAIPRAPWYQVWDNLNLNRKPWRNEYSFFLRAFMVNKVAWSSVESCLRHVRLCEKFHDPDNITVMTIATTDPFLTRGCCIPPNRCGLVKVNGSETLWEMPKTGVSANDGECQEWTKVTDGKCYSCDMCKASYLVGMHSELSKVRRHYFRLIFFLAITMFIVVFGALQDPEELHQANDVFS